jgi:lysophospholipase L1-like esterase
MFNTFVLSLFIATFILLAITRLTAKRLIESHHRQKVDFFLKHPIQPGDIVFLGDSLTDGARWGEMFPGLHVKNRGINADSTAGVLARLDEIISGKPSAIFILIGTNDLPWYEYKGDGEIFESYEKILARCKAEMSETKVHVQSILPRHSSYAKRIKNLNLRLEKLAEQYGYTYIDLYSRFVDDQGGLRRELTNDNLHLLGSGYLIWGEQLQFYLREVNR